MLYRKFRNWHCVTKIALKTAKRGPSQTCSFELLLVTVLLQDNSDCAVGYLVYHLITFVWSLMVLLLHILSRMSCLIHDSLSLLYRRYNNCTILCDLKTFIRNGSPYLYSPLYPVMYHCSCLVFPESADTFRIRDQWTVAAKNEWMRLNWGVLWSACYTQGLWNIINLSTWKCEGDNCVARRWIEGSE